MDYPALERLDQLARNLEGVAQRLGERVDELREEPLETRSTSGVVRVLTDPSGQVTQVELDSYAMRLSSDRLGEEITETILRAQREAATRFRTAITDVLGAAAPADPALG